MTTPAIFPKIATKLNLGHITAPPKKLTGGFAHEVFSLTTNQHQYAIKLLNPDTMANPYMAHILATAEQLETTLQLHHLSFL